MGVISLAVSFTLPVFQGVSEGVNDHIGAIFFSFWKAAEYFQEINRLKSRDERGGHTLKYFGSQTSACHEGWTTIRFETRCSNHSILDIEPYIEIRPVTAMSVATMVAESFQTTEIPWSADML